MKIDKSCKFLIFFITTLGFGGLFILGTMFFLMSYSSINSTFNGLSGLRMLFTDLIASGFLSIVFLTLALVFWCVITSILLVFGSLSAPDENENQSGVGKKGIVLGIIILVAATGLLMSSTLKGLDILLVLGITIVIEFILIDYYYSIPLGNEEKVGFKRNVGADIYKLYEKVIGALNNAIKEKDSRYEHRIIYDSNGKVAGALTTVIKKDKEFESSLQETEERVLDNPFSYCSRCGQKLSEEDIFCKYCGNKLR